LKLSVYRIAFGFCCQNAGCPSGTEAASTERGETASYSILKPIQRSD
jgi:hypothetical protein